MNRRVFLASAAMAAQQLSADGERKKLLLPSDQPDALNFRLMWYNPVAPIDEKTYQLKIGGLVEKPTMMNVSEVRGLPRETQSSRMKCVQCWSARTMWDGFRYGALADVVKPKKTAGAIRIDCADKWYEYFTMKELANPRILFVTHMGGELLADRHGAPLRMIDPSKYGYKSAKLITSITFVEEGKGSMACDIGPYYSPSGDILAGYDTPLDLGGKLKKKIRGGEITEY